NIGPVLRGRSQGPSYVTPTNSCSTTPQVVSRHLEHLASTRIDKAHDRRTTHPRVVRTEILGPGIEKRKSLSMARTFLKSGGSCTGALLPFNQQGTTEKTSRQETGQ